MSLVTHGFKEQGKRMSVTPRQAAGIAIPSWAPERWTEWFAPERQPFVIDELPAEDVRALPDAEKVDCSPEIRDAFWIYGQRPRIWLTEADFTQLDRRLRARLVRAQLYIHQSIGLVKNAAPVVRDRARTQGDGYRFVWWPSLVKDAGLEPVITMIETTVRHRPSRHLEVPAQVWDRAADVLPQARELAGTFAERSGPEGFGANCFGTVRAACGVPGAAYEMPFEDWLSLYARRGGRDEEPGTILVWHDEEHVPVHAAVTLGEGWALNKPSQAWKSPRFVWTVREVIYHSRYKGCHLHRYTILR
jgi:hypothetical protein